MSWFTNILSGGVDKIVDSRQHYWKIRSKICHSTH